MRLAALLTLCVLSSSAQAQSAWRAAPESAVSLDALVATESFGNLADDDGSPLDTEAGVVASALQLAARLPVGERLALRVEVPLTVRIYTGDFFDATLDPPNEFAVGNPLVGAEFALPAPSGLSRLAVGADVRLPLASSDAFGPYGEAALAGGLADRLRAEAYAGRTASLHLRAVTAVEPTPESRVTAEVGPVYSYAFESPEGQETFGFPNGNLGVLGSLIGAVRVGAVSLGGGVAARYEPDAGWLRYDQSRLFADGTVHASLEGLPVRPGVQIVVPLASRFAGTPGAVLGLHLDVPLR